MTQNTYEPDEGAGLRSTTPRPVRSSEPNPRRSTARGAKQGSGFVAA